MKRSSIGTRSGGGGRVKPLACNPIRGRRPVPANCTIAELQVDTGYQRSIENSASQALIRSIARDWDWRLCQPLEISRRISDDGESLFVVDGQHRLAAARLRRDIYDLPCIVTEYGSVREEIDAFLALNDKRRPLSALDKFRASVARGEEGSVEVMALVSAAGLTLAPHSNFRFWKPGMISNIAGIRKFYARFGAEPVGEALAMIGRTYADEVLRYAGTLFPGLVQALAGEEPEGGDCALLEQVLAGATQAEWSQEINTIIGARGIHRNEASAIAIRNAWEEAAAECREEELEAA